jgi:hypothetical protein
LSLHSRVGKGLRRNATDIALFDHQHEAELQPTDIALATANLFSVSSVHYFHVWWSTRVVCFPSRRTGILYNNAADASPPSCLVLWVDVNHRSDNSGASATLRLRDPKPFLHNITSHGSELYGYTTDH